ncbi:MAG: flavodoxin [Clostridiales bacterium]|jgi:flavodoxin short chain|nr:flavodoxin [Clostridiales bacterium]
MKTVIVFWSGTGNTEALAQSVAKGVQAAGGSADVFKVGEITPEQAAAYDKIALGCPAMGAEELEEAEFAPFYDALEPLLKGKTVGLFGSYDWGDGEWMRLWEKRAADAGLNVAATLTVQSAEPGVGESVAFGKKLA